MIKKINRRKGSEFTYSHNKLVQTNGMQRRKKEVKNTERGIKNFFFFFKTLHYMNVVTLWCWACRKCVGEIDDTENGKHCVQTFYINFRHGQTQNSSFKSTQ